jgi:hypothetical protein
VQISEEEGRLPVECARANVCAARDEHSDDVAVFPCEVEWRVYRLHEEVNPNYAVAENVLGAVDEAGQEKKRREKLTHRP